MLVVLTICSLANQSCQLIGLHPAVQSGLREGEIATIEDLKKSPQSFNGEVINVSGTVTKIEPERIILSDSLVLRNFTDEALGRLLAGDEVGVRGTFRASAFPGQLPVLRFSSISYASNRALSEQITDGNHD